MLAHFAPWLRSGLSPNRAFLEGPWAAPWTLSFIAIKDIEPCLIYKISKIGLDRHVFRGCRKWRLMEEAMAWTTPILVEICIGLEINGYLPAEF